MKTLFTILLVSYFLQGCSDPSQNLSPVPNDGIILAFGDSLTVGVGVNSEYSYPTILSKLSGLKVINGGVSGETTTVGLKRFEGWIIEKKPSLIVLLEGGNDILRKQDLAKTKQNLKSMVLLAEKHHVQIVLIGVPERLSFSSSAPMYEEISDEFNLVFEEEIISHLMYRASYKSDMVHFNRAGYQKLAQTIYELLVENGALADLD